MVDKTIQKSKVKSKNIMLQKAVNFDF